MYLWRALQSRARCHIELHIQQGAHIVRRHPFDIGRQHRYVLIEIFRAIQNGSIDFAQAIDQLFEQGHLACVNIFHAFALQPFLRV